MKYDSVCCVEKEWNHRENLKRFEIIPHNILQGFLTYGKLCRLILLVIGPNVRESAGSVEDTLDRTSRII